jgi:glycine/D-amino acid oxidase-like deaminating enzyme
MRVAIIGAGPAGATLATLLASEGTDVTLFDDGRRPELLVGESLIPALVPTNLVAYLYDGRMPALIRAGRDWVMQPGRVRGLKTAAQNHIERQIALRASGMRTSSRYCTALMRLLGRRGLRGVAPDTLAIR